MGPQTASRKASINPRLHVDTFQFTTNLSRIEGQVEKELRKALSIAGLVVQRQSMENCPVDTGFLRASAFRSDIQQDRSKLLVHIGHSAAYATYVHERLDSYHPVGMAKYLERALLEKKREIAKDIDQAIRKGMAVPQIKVRKRRTQ